MVMKKIMIIIEILFCFVCCNNKTKQDRIVFCDELLPKVQGTYSLDSIIQLSHEKNKPLLLWFSTDANRKDADFHLRINRSQQIKEYLLDSMFVFRLILDRKTKIEDIKSPEMNALLPIGRKFKSEGSIGRWINKTYFDSLEYMMVVTDHEFNRMSPCNQVHEFYEDSIAFMNFLVKAKHKYDSCITLKKVY